MYSKFSKNPFLEIVKTKNKSNPYKISFLTRFLFIAAGLKDYILALIDNPFTSYMVTALCAHTFFIMEVLLVHKEINEISSFAEHKSIPWKEKTISQKISSLFFAFLLVFTISVMVYLGVEARRLMQKEKERQNEKVKENKNEIEENEKEENKNINSEILLIN